MTERTDAPEASLEREVETDAPRTEREIADELRLRPTLPGVTRLSRKVLIGLGAVASIGVGGALMLGLQGRDGGDEPSELYNTDRVAQADGLGNLPRDYSGLRPDVPQLGPPLPGDMGRPMLSAQERGQPVPIPPAPGAPSPPVAAAPPVDPAIQRAAQEREAARTSQLFSGGQSGDGQVGPPVSLSTAPPAVAAEPTAQPSGRGETFLARETDRRTVSPDRIRLPASSYVLQAGSVIPAALVTGLRSDLPGQVTAQVTSPVDSSPPCEAAARKARCFARSILANISRASSK